MNYLDITLIGYKSTTDFTQHIYREYKKAIENHYSLNEFFDGCNNAVKAFANLFEEQNSRRIEMYYKAIDTIENDSNRSEEQKVIDIGRVEKEIESISVNDSGIPLATLSKNRLTGHLWFSDVIAMQKGVVDALEMAENEIEKSMSTPKNVTIDFEEVYEQEVTEERKEKLYADLEKIEGIPEKIAFLENEKYTYLQNIPFRTFEASGKLIAGGFPSGALFFDRFIELEIEKLKKQAKGPVMQIESLIKTELIDGRLVEVENKLKDKIEDWKIGKDKIGCAAFCEMLFEKGYFFKKITERKGPIQFGLIRYGIDITVQMGTTKKKDRELHKVKLKRYFA